MIGYRATSDEMVEKIGTNETAFRWDFKWGLEQQQWFIAAFILFLFLHTIKLILEELTETSMQTEPGEDGNG